MIGWVMGVTVNQDIYLSEFVPDPRFDPERGASAVNQADAKSPQFNHLLFGKVLLDIERVHIAADGDQLLQTRKIFPDAPVNEISGMDDLIHPFEMSFDNLLKLLERLL